MAKQLNMNLMITADTAKARAEINALQQSLTKIGSGVGVSGIGNILTKDLQQASLAANQLQAHLSKAMNPETGTLNFTQFNNSVKKSGTTVEQLGAQLLKAGATGQQSFMQLTAAIAKSEVPIARLNKGAMELWTTLKNTARWQLTSSMIHGFVGGLQGAYRFAKGLNRSLNDIRIVTNASANDMAKFAEQANKAAKALNTTTTKYTDASLIYYQQGLSDKDVKARTDVTVKMANVARIGAQEASDQLTAIWNNFYDGTQSIEHYADVLVKLGAATASSSDEISAGMEKFAAIADTVGLSYEYAAGALATVTATTRQSADVVGNAFKTLFGRLEGLQLGETLEDGTTLNKYSDALRKVGVDIKTVNGEIKDMDIILDELGGKWKTLGKDQQIALAQTVGGMRQYNQLIALMDNYDFFKQNVSLAKNADGALQEQADIYGESWEAAAARVRAATESIFQDLLKDKGFIGILNIFEKLLTGVDHFIDGLGGLQGVLLTIGSIATSVFGKQIAGGLRDAGGAIKQIIAGPKAAQAEKAAAYEDLLDTYALSPQNKNTAADMARNDVNSAIAIKQRELMMNASRMTEDQRKAGNIHIDDLRAAGADYEYKAKQHDDSLDRLEDLMMDSSLENRSVYRDYGKLEAIVQRSKTDSSITSDDFESFVQILSEEDQLTFNEKFSNDKDGALDLIKASFEEKLKTDKVKKKQQQEARDIRTSGRQAKSQEYQTKDSKKNFDTLNRLGHLTAKELRTNAHEEAENAKKLAEAAQTNKKSAEEALEIANQKLEQNQNDKKLIAKKEEAQKNYEEAEAQVNRTSQKANKAELKANKLDEMDDKDVEAQQYNPEDAPKIEPSGVDKVVAASSAIMALGTAISTVQGLIDVWNNTDMSFGEKIANSAFSAVPAITSLITAFNALQAANMLGTMGLGAFMGWAAAAVAAVIVLSKGIEHISNRINAFEIGQEKTTELFANLEAEKEKVDSLEASLQSVQDKIRELQNIRGLDLVQQEELATLQAEEASLQAQLELQQQLYQLELERAILEAGKNAAPINKDKSDLKRPKAKAPNGVWASEDIKTEEDYWNEYIAPVQKLIELYTKQSENNGSLSRLESFLMSNLEDKLRVGNINEAQKYLTNAQGNLAEFKTGLSSYLIEINEQISTETDNYLNYVKSMKALGKEISETDPTLQIYQDNLKALRMRMVSGDEEEYNKKYVDSVLSDMARGDKSDELDSIYTALSTGKATDFNSLSSELQKALSEQALYKGLSTEELFARIQNNMGEAAIEIQAELKADEDGELREQLNSLTAEQWEILFNLLANDTPVQGAIAAALAYDGSTITIKINAADDTYNSLQEIADKVQNGEALSDIDLTTLENNGIDISTATRAAGGGWEFNPAYLEENVDFLKQASTDGYDEIVDAWGEKYYAAQNRDMVDDKSDFIFDTQGGDTALITEKNTGLLGWLFPGLNSGLDLGITKEEGISELQDRAAFLKQYEGQTYSIEQEDGSFADTNVNSILDKITYAVDNGEISEMNEALAESADLINAIRYDYEDAGLMTEETLWAAQAAEAAEFNEELAHFGYTMEDLAPYMEKIKKSNPDWEKQGVEIKRQAMAMKALEDGLADYEDSLKELEDTENNMSATTEDVSAAFDRYHENVEKIVGQKLDKEFTKALRAAGKLDPKLVRTEKGIQGLNKAVAKMNLAKATKQGDELTKALDDIANGTENSTELFEDWGKSLNVPEDQIDGFADNVSTALDGIEPLNAGDLVTGSAADALNAILADLQSGKMSLTEALQQMEALGVEPVLTAESTSVPATSVTNGAVEIIGSQQGSYEVGDESIHYEANPVQNTVNIPETTVYAPKIEFRKKGDGTAPGANLNAGGGGRGGGGGGGGGKPKIKKKASIDHRYHTNKQRKSNVESKIKNQEAKTERSFGQAKVDSLKEQLKLQKELNKNSREYIEEVASYLRDDKKLLEYYKNLMHEIQVPELKFDKNGIIANATEIRRIINEALANLEMGEDFDSTNIDNFLQAMDDYESTLAAWDEAVEQIVEGLNKIIELGLEIVTTKLELRIELDDLDLEHADYLLSRVEENAWGAAAAFAAMTDKLDSYQSKLHAYSSAFDMILGSRGLTQEMLETMSDEELITHMGDQVMYTTEELEQLKDSASELLSVMTEQWAAYGEAVDKLGESFDFINEKMDSQIALFEHYTSILDNFKEIMDVTNLGRTVAGQAVLQNLRATEIENGKNTLQAIKSSLALAQESLQQQVETRDAAIAAIQSDNALTEDQRKTAISTVEAEWEEVLTSAEERIQDLQRQFMDTWTETLSTAKDEFESFIEEIAAQYEQALSYGFGSFDIFESAYETKQQIDEEYLDDYEKLYELSKLTRNITNSMDETDNIKGKQRLKDLQAEINRLQKEGVELSQYDVDVLTKKYELELARQAVEDAAADKSLVRLQRDQSGNWGYVYTADEDEIAKKEQEYEDKLYEYQKLNDEYITELEEKIADIRSDYMDQMQEILTSSLSDEEKALAIAQLEEDTAELVAIVESQYAKVFDNQSGTLWLMEELYGVTGPALIDSWKETVLGLTTGTDSLTSYFDDVKKSMREMADAMKDAYNEYQDLVDDIIDSAVPGLENPEDLADFLNQSVEHIKDLSSAALEETENMADKMDDLFEDAIEGLREFQNEWVNGLEDLFGKETVFENMTKLLRFFEINSLETLDSKLLEELEEQRNIILDANSTDAEVKAAELSIKQLEIQLEELHNKIADYYAEYADEITNYDSSASDNSAASTSSSAEAISAVSASEVAQVIQANVNAVQSMANSMATAGSVVMKVDNFTQEVHITAEFPAAEDRTEIEEAFNNLLNDAVQYAFERD